MTGPPRGPGPPGGSQARWVLTPGMSWLGRAAMAVVLTVCLAAWAFGEVAVLLVIWATLGAATGLWSGPHSFVMTTYAPTGYLVVAAALVWLALWTGGGSFTAGLLHTALSGRDVIELRPGELLVRPRWPRRPTRIAANGIRGVYLLPGGGDVMVRTPDGSVRITEFGTGEERAALAGALRLLLEVPAEATWGPALPAGFTAEHRPEGIVIVPGAATHRGNTEWLAASGTVTVREHEPGSGPREIFAGGAAELTAAPSDDADDDDLICRLTLLAGPEPPAPGERSPGSADRYVLLDSRDDPTAPRELGLWLADNARIAFDDQITD